MKTLVLYDSVYGNTKKIAEKISQELNAKLMTVTKADPTELSNYDLLIFGTPTHAFNPTNQMKNFINKIPKGSLIKTRFASFDTRISLDHINSPILNFFTKIFGYAAKPLARKLSKKGSQPALDPIGFNVIDTKGPIENGQLKRVDHWIAKLKEAL